MKHKLNIYQDGQNISLEAQDGESVLDVLQKNNIDIDAPCGGYGTCKKCRIEQIENDIASINLACKTHIYDDMTIKIPKIIKSNILVDGIRRNQTIIDKKTGYSIAIDIGTTTIALALVDLYNSQIIDTIAQINPQKKYGADVISRITYTMEKSNGTKQLQSCLVQKIEDMLLEIIEQNNCGIEEITEIFIAGNTVMQHLFLGEDTSGLAVTPFEAKFLNGISIHSSKLGFKHPYIVHIMPSLSAYIGGDITSAMITCSMDKTNKTTLLIDLGTNGEMILSKKDRFYSCSVAAGPVFEGNHIKYGTGSIMGAIDHVSFNHGMIEISTIQKKPSLGICGSGLIDIIAELIKNNIIDENGTFLSKIQVDAKWRRYLCIEDEKLAFQITPKITITQDDIRQVQLAKSAFSAGIKTLLYKSNTDYSQVECVYLAGGMGNFIDKENATIIGLFPRELTDKIKIVGNASLNGVVDVSINNELFKKADKFRQKTINIELGNQDYFQDLYIEEMVFNKK